MTHGIVENYKASWSTYRLKYATTFLSRGDSPTYVDSGGTPVINQACVSPSGIRFSAVKFEESMNVRGWKGELHGGEVLVNSTGTGTLGRVAYLQHDKGGYDTLIADGHVTILRCRPEVLSEKYLFYYLSTRQEEITVLCSEGATNQIELGRESFGSFVVPVPDVKKQKTIVSYLDREIVQIDELVAEKEKMLKILGEKRSTLISQAVTRGIDPNVKTKPSGVDWLGEIPYNWETYRSKRLFDVRDERSENGSEELLTVSHLTGVTLRAEKDVNMFKADSLEGYKKCGPGNLAINTLWAWMGAMGIAKVDGIVSPDYHVYRLGPKLRPDFVEYLCRSKPFIAEVNRHSKGVWSSRLRLYPEAFFQIVLAVPSIEEQLGIVKHLDSQLGESAKLDENLRDSIRLLGERRTALISAAVTGKIDIAGLN